MKIVIVGDGKIGSTLAEQLSREGHEVTIIDQNAVPLHQTVEDLDILCVEGNGAMSATQLEAGVDSADLLIAVTASDELNLSSRDRIKSWERIYLEEGPEGFAVERRGRSSKGRPPKRLPKEVTEDLLVEVQRLRAEVDYLKNLQALVLEDERRQHKKRW